MTPVRTIAIIGAGFSGTATAVHLLNAHHERPLHVVLIERGAEFGRGVAYAIRRFPYLLNVPAARMSASSDAPDDYLRFARLSQPGVDGEAFLNRQSYGDYLAALLERTARSLPAHVRLTQQHGDITDLATGAPAAPVKISFADGTHLLADQAVIATGGGLPRLPVEIRSEVTAPLLRPHPWAPGRTLTANDTLLILGTGLTMADVTLEVIDRHPKAHIHAISRHGLMPYGQTAFAPQSYRTDATTLRSATGSVRKLMSATRALAAEAIRQQADWREVVTALRHELPGVWQTLTAHERRRFLRHARPFWEVHRHRLPTSVADRLGALVRAGQLTIHAGRVSRLITSNDQVIAHFRPRGRSAESQLTAREVVNCTGPDYDISTSSEGLWRSLLNRGLVTQDALKLGIETSTTGALVTRDGSVSTQLFYVGPMLRARYWEATAVGELREHAERLALTLSRMA